MNNLVRGKEESTVSRRSAVSKNYAVKNSNLKLVEDFSQSIYNENGGLKLFKEINVSTKTMIGSSNLKIDLEKFFNYMPITDYTPTEKKRGRKRRIQVVTKKNNIPFGSIICLQRRKEIRGTSLKEKKEKQSFFLHSVSLVMFLDDDKIINTKVSSNGKFQVTGCKSDEHFIQTITNIYNIMIETEICIGEKIFTFNPDTLNTEENKLSIIYNTVMQNMYFNVGFYISREKLDYFINNYTNYKSIYEGSILTSVNIKVESEDVNSDFNKFIYENQELTHDILPYEKYYDTLDAKEKKKKKKKKYHTFLVFASGKIIMVSKGPQMEKIYNEVITILLNNRKYFEDDNYSSIENVPDTGNVSDTESISDNQTLDDENELSESSRESKMMPNCKNIYNEIRTILNNKKHSDDEPIPDLQSDPEGLRSEDDEVYFSDSDDEKY
jgi:TATA-box binding protein (TBP) (component of TFIID and TFIIIB)